MSEFDKLFEGIEKIVEDNWEEFNQATRKLRPDKPKWVCWEEIDRSERRAELTNYARQTDSTIKHMLETEFYMREQLRFLEVLTPEAIADDLTLTHLYLTKILADETPGKTYQRFLGKIELHNGRFQSGKESHNKRLFPQAISKIMEITARELYQKHESEQRNPGSAERAEIMRE
jgi:hypothetical protein